MHVPFCDNKVSGTLMNVSAHDTATEQTPDFQIEYLKWLDIVVMSDGSNPILELPLGTWHIYVVFVDPNISQRKCELIDGDLVFFVQTVDDVPKIVLSERVGITEDESSYYGIWIDIMVLIPNETETIPFGGLLVEYGLVV